MRILIIDDNGIIVRAIENSLKSFYIVDKCGNGKEGLHNIETVNYDAILLDLNLPDISGEEICAHVRKKGIKAPIIIISGKSDVKNRIDMLNMGADDYLSKPFNHNELHARINAAIRRGQNGAPERKITVGSLMLDPMTRKVTRNGNEILLRRKEFDLLEYLMRNDGQTLTRYMILEHVWANSEDLWANVVDVHIKYLRDKIDRSFNDQLIKTVHGLGYKIEASEK